jgi:lysophospholipase L1-like esterase
VLVLTVSLATLAAGLRASAEEKSTPPEIRQLAAAVHPGERIAFLGDSITQAGVGPGGYVTLIEEGLEQERSDAKAVIIKAGISGHKVPDLQKRLDRDVLSKKPTIVFIYIGINDVWHSTSGHGTPKDRYEAGLRDLIQRINQAGAKVVLATPSVIGEKPDGSNPLDKMLEEYSAISRKVAEETKTPMCDLRKAFLSYLTEKNKDNKDRGILTSDTVHLSPAGNQFVARQAAAAIAGALK